MITYSTSENVVVTLTPDRVVLLVLVVAPGVVLLLGHQPGHGQAGLVGQLHGVRVVVFFELDFGMRSKQRSYFL